MTSANILPLPPVAIFHYIPSDCRSTTVQLDYDHHPQPQFFLITSTTEYLCIGWSQVLQVRGFRIVATTGLPPVFRIRIRIKLVSRIRIPNADPDPAADKISSKSQYNSYHLEIFD
jgi:hypothetical protein